MTEYDLIIIGGGPGGVAAGVYAARKKLKTLFVTKEWGGQSVVSTDIQNWIGTPSISGADLAKSLEGHLRAYAEGVLTIKDNVLATSVKKDSDEFSVTLDDGTTATAKTVLVTSGSKRRRLEVSGADKFEHKGLTYCASCDGPLFSGMDVAVIGGGNAGFETAAQLLAYAKSVTLLNRTDSYKADPITVDHVLADEKMTGLLNAEIESVAGDAFVSGITYKDKVSGETHSLPVSGVFIEIGMIPNTEFVSNLVELDEYNRIKIDPWTGKTNVPGVWAAGDCTNIKYHQNNISVGDAVKAIEDIYVHLKTK